MNPDTALAGDFFRRLVTHNSAALAGFAAWVFHPGMLFGASREWWGEGRRRATPHEGLDLVCFQDDALRLHLVPETLAVPAPLAGEVARLVPDFLGTSIFLRHPVFREGCQLYTALGHTRPLATLTLGAKVAAGDCLATLAGTRRRPTRVPAHLHLTFAWLPASASPEALNWRTLGHDPAVRLVDPLTLLPLPFRLSESRALLRLLRELPA